MISKPISDLPPLPDQAGLLDVIEQYKQDVLRRKIPCTLNDCPRCQQSATTFKPHDVRQRIFYIIVDQIVKRTICLVLRFKCPNCDKKFTQLPDFAMPYKRYVRPTLLHYLSVYLDYDQVSWRGLLDFDPIEHENHWDGLNHSTLFRWVNTLGQLNHTMAQAQALILQKQPHSSICTDVARTTVASGKWRKPYRQKLLIQCKRLLKIERIFHRCFQISIFPMFATRCGFN
jgi:hypothetical protein